MASATRTRLGWGLLAVVAAGLLIWQLVSAVRRDSGPH